MEAKEIGPQWPSTPEEYEKLAYDLDWEILKVKEEMLEAKRKFVFKRQVSLDIAQMRRHDKQYKLKEKIFTLRIDLLSARKEIALLKCSKIWIQEYVEILEQNQN